MVDSTTPGDYGGGNLSPGTHWEQYGVTGKLVTDIPCRQQPVIPTRV